MVTTRNALICSSIFSFSFFQSVATQNAVFRAYGNKCFRFSRVEKVFPYLNKNFFVFYTDGFFLTFVSERINFLLGSSEVLGQ